MVRKIEHDKKEAFQCESCGLKYWKKEDAEACQKYCEKHPGTCDPIISERAIKE